MILRPSEVTACLVTRGNVDMTRIIEPLEAAGVAEILIWDNSKRGIDLKVFGRYEMTKYAETDWIAWQDDDTVFEAWDELFAAAEPDTFVSNNAHGPNHGGYDDLALQAAGAICPLWLIADTWNKWFQRYPLDERPMTDVHDLDVPISMMDGVLWEADFIFGVLCKRWKQVDLPYTRLYADDTTRLCRQPFQEELKLYMTTLARGIRDEQ